MPFLGFLILAAGVYLVDSAVQNRHPLTTLSALIKDPKNAPATLASTKGTGFVSASYTPGTGTVTGTVATNPSAGTGAGSGAVAFARAQIGKPYGWGKSGPDSYDCSGLCQAAWGSVGVKLPRTSGLQIMVGTRVAKNDLQPGDLVMPYPGHIFMYSGNGNVIEAPKTGGHVQEVNMYAFLTARRPTSAAKTVTA